jgi:hypothetical protein
MQAVAVGLPHPGKCGQDGRIVGDCRGGFLYEFFRVTRTRGLKIARPFCERPLSERQLCQIKHLLKRSDLMLISKGLTETFHTWLPGSSRTWEL